jgi:hypothetical protein
MKVTLHGTLTTNTAAGGQSAAQVQGRPHPVAVLLFGKRPPKLVDRKRYPKLKKALRKLEYVKGQIAELLGVADNQFSVELCEGDNAFISREGQIAVGVELLEKHQDDDDLMVAILGHEMGHQPWSWPDGDLSHLNRAQLQKLYREEEAKADRFAGRVLAELGASPDAVCRFLVGNERFEGHAPSDYYPAKTRAAMIRRAYRERRRALKEGHALFPALAARARDLR